MGLPDFFIVGAPKAGTTALHAALATHPELHLSPVKEPKYFLCGDRPPTGQRGPGDAHSAREWVWRRDRYEALFAGAPPGALTGESTPFYLADEAALARMAAAAPGARLIAVLRDPVDRAYSNWMHLWSDGLEPEADFEAACAAEPARIAAGWAPFWHYLALGRYGEQLEALLRHHPRHRLHVLRYRDLVDRPEATLDAIARFLGVTPGLATVPGPENTRPFVADGPRTRALARVVRAGAAAGAHLPPQVWRRASAPLTAALQRGAAVRPQLDVATRRRLVAHFVDDNAVLGRVLGEPFDDWLGDRGRGEYATRRAGPGDGA